MDCKNIRTNISEAVTSPITEDLIKRTSVEETLRKIDAINRPANMLSIIRNRSVSNVDDCERFVSGLIPDYFTERKIWDHIIAKWKDFGKNKSLLFKVFVYRGIPQEYRGRVWQHLLIDDNSVSISNIYSQCLQKQCLYEEQIQQDLPRTFPEIPEFAHPNGRLSMSLYNVLKAYSIYDSEVGYCQAMSFIVGILLMHLSEDHAFEAFVKIMDQHKLRDIYKPDMQRFNIMVYQFKESLRLALPALNRHMHNCFFDITVICSHFLTMFCNMLSLDAVFAIMDAFIIDGIDVIPKVTTSILSLNQDKLLQCDLEDLLRFFHKDVRDLYTSDTCKLLMLQAKRVRLSKNYMDKLEKEYIWRDHKHRKSVQDSRILRDEVSTLQERIRRLEMENETLAEKLLHAQVECLKKEDVSRRMHESRRETLRSERQRRSSYHQRNNSCSYRGNDSGIDNRHSCSTSIDGDTRDSESI